MCLDTDRVICCVQWLSMTLVKLHADGEHVATVEDAQCPDVVRSEQSTAVGLRNLVTQWHITQKGALPSECCFEEQHSCSGSSAWLLSQCSAGGLIIFRDACLMWLVLFAQGSRSMLFQPSRYQAISLH